MRLVIYTDDALLALGTLGVLSSLVQFQVISAPLELSGLLPMVERFRPKVILIDLTPEMTFGLISALRTAAPDAHLILWGRWFSEELRHQARQLGIEGFLPHGISAEQFAGKLTEIAGGDCAAPQELAHSKTVVLTKRESQLVTLLVQGLKNKEIASCLAITEGTVRIYLSKLL